MYIMYLYFYNGWQMKYIYIHILHFYKVVMRLTSNSFAKIIPKGFNFDFLLHTQIQSSRKNRS